MNWKAVRIVVLLTSGIIILLLLIGMAWSFVLGESVTFVHAGVYGLLAWFGWSMAEKHSDWYERISRMLDGKSKV